MIGKFPLGGGIHILHKVKRLEISYEAIISPENLLLAWQEFVKGKQSKSDVQEFGRNFMDNLFELYADLKHQTYKHGAYHAFNISDPKPRHIHKACVRDRLVHHAIYRQLYPFFDKKFISDSYSCRLKKGTHKAMKRFRDFAYKVTKNNTRTCFVLKCDIRKFFATVNHEVLLNLLTRHIVDAKILWLLKEIINSFCVASDTGLPLGNLTSQLLVNIYMDEFDQFIKHKLKAKYYIRYADDFVILNEDCSWLQALIEPIADFLKHHLCLELHPDKVYIKTVASGVDFLGWVHFPDHRILRTVTKKRMIRNLNKDPKPESVASYSGMLKHGNAHKVFKSMIKTFKNN